MDRRGRHKWAEDGEETAQSRPAVVTPTPDGGAFVSKTGRSGVFMSREFLKRIKSGEYDTDVLPEID